MTLRGKRTYIGIAILTLAGLLGLDPDATLAAAGIEAEADARVLAQLIVLAIGAAVAAYGRFKATQQKPEGEFK